MRIAVFAGSFDPFTIGHQYIVNKGLKIFDKIIIGIANNSNKSGFYSIEDRKKCINYLYQHNDKVDVQVIDGMVGDFCQSVKADFILRGIRNSIDFEYENNMAQINKKIFPSLTTIFITPDPEYGCISSSMVRELIKYGKDIDKYLPESLEILNMI